MITDVKKATYSSMKLTLLFLQRFSSIEVFQTRSIMNRKPKQKLLWHHIHLKTLILMENKKNPQYYSARTAEHSEKAEK